MAYNYDANLDQITKQDVELFVQNQFSRLPPNTFESERQRFLSLIGEASLFDIIIVVSSFVQRNYLLMLANQHATP